MPLFGLPGSPRCLQLSSMMDAPSMYIQAPLVIAYLGQFVIFCKQKQGQCAVTVLPRLMMPGHRIVPPCGRVNLQFEIQRPIADMEIASMHLKHLAALPKVQLPKVVPFRDQCDEGGSIRAMPNLPPGSPPLPPPSPKAAATVMGFIACLRRLLASRTAASHVMSCLLRDGSEGVAAEAALQFLLVVALGIQIY